MTLKEAGVTLIDCDHKTPPASEEGYPYIAIPQLKNGLISLEGVRRISHVDYLAWTKKLKPQANDVIVVRRCNSGDSAHVPAGLECAIGQNLVVLRASGERVRPDFLRWLLKGPEWWAEVSKYINVGAVFDSLRCRDIPNFELTIPPLEEQAEIARVLRSLDDRITLLRETNATLEAIAQALFKSWFVDFDPVRANIAAKNAPEGAVQGSASAAQDTTAGMPEAGQRREPLPTMPAAALDAATAALFPDSFEESELGLVPRGWSYSTIGQSFILTMGQSPPGDTYNENGEGVPFYQGRTDFGFRFPKQRVFCTEPSRLAITGDTLVSVRAPVGDVNIALDECALGRGVAGLRHPEGHQSFVFYAVRCLKPYFEMHDGEGTVFGSINKKDFQALPIVLPPENLLTSFESIVTPIDAAIENNEKKLRCLTQLRDTLLPRLISGQLRLSEAQQTVAEAMQ